MIRLTSHLFNAAACVSLAVFGWTLAADSSKRAQLRIHLAGLIPGLATVSSESRPGHVSVAGDRQEPTLAERDAPAAPQLPGETVVTRSGETSIVSIPRVDPKQSLGRNEPESVGAPAAAGPRDLASEVRIPEPRETQAINSPTPADPARGPETARTAQSRSSPAGAPSVGAAAADVIVPPIRRQRPSAAVAPRKAKPKLTTSRPAKSKPAAAAKTAVTAKPAEAPGRSSLGSGRITPPTTATSPRDRDAAAR